MTNYPETPKETEALDVILVGIKDILSLYDLKHTGPVIVNSPSFRAVLRLLYLAGQQDALKESIRAKSQ
jgi:hypothetical protein